MKHAIHIYEDPRLLLPQCEGLTPIETLHENPWFVVRNRGGYFTTEYRHPQVIVLPIVDDESVVMVRVNRPVITDSPLELPAGSAGKNEDPRAAAAREFGEETGIRIKDLERFSLNEQISNSPNRTPTLLHIYHIAISQEEFESRTSHDDEIERVECYRFEELKRMLVKGEIYVSAPMAVIGRFLLSRCDS